MPKTPEGLTLNQASEYLQTNRNFIAAYIKEGILPASEGQVKGRTILLITESDLKEFSELHEKKIWEDRLSQRQYYNKKAKEAVYQRFSSPSIPEAILMRKVLGDWYFIVPGTNDTFSYMEGVYTHRLTPNYSIEVGKRSTNPAYAVLNLSAFYSPYLSSDGFALSAGSSGQSIYGTIKGPLDHLYKRRTVNWCFG
ncbi:helix-turn-helix domain-containing protein [Domibacillus sp. 8LH]|uniref:helix-turn-helix domain-containing protein n=1 Tax=Domibacillus sp. 8LH TaxID=3073900 RepID=UPI00317C26D3